MLDSVLCWGAGASQRNPAWMPCLAAGNRTHLDSDADDTPVIGKQEVHPLQFSLDQSLHPGPLISWSQRTTRADRVLGRVLKAQTGQKGRAGDGRQSRRGVPARPSMPCSAVPRKAFLLQAATVHLARLRPWALQTTVSEWQQALLPFRRALGFSCRHTRARHHSQCFRTWQQCISTHVMMRTARATMETTTKAVMACFFWLAATTARRSACSQRAPT